MQYPDAYSNILRTLNPKVRSTLDNHYGINLKPETQTELDILRGDLDLVLKEDIKTTANATHTRECVQKLREALH